MSLNFQECDSCNNQTGTPKLCSACLVNREAIAGLNRKLDKKLNTLCKLVGAKDISWEMALFRAGDLIATLKKVKTIAENTLMKFGKGSGLQQIINEVNSILDGIKEKENEAMDNK